MARQEEIEEGVVQVIEGEILGTIPLRVGTKVLKYLRSQGLVLRVERELPENGVIVNTSKRYKDGFDFGQSYYRLKIVEAGYCAVEELIKEQKKDGETI